MGAQSKEEAILRAQQLDLIYFQSGMLYKILSNNPRAETYPTKETPSPHADGVIDSIVSQVKNSMGQVNLQQNTTTSQNKTWTPTSTTEVLSM